MLPLCFTVVLQDGPEDPQHVYDVLDRMLGLPDLGMLRAARNASSRHVTCTFQVSAKRPGDVLVHRATGALRQAFPGARVRVRVDRPSTRGAPVTTGGALSVVRLRLEPLRRAPVGRRRRHPRNPCFPRCFQVLRPSVRSGGRLRMRPRTNLPS